MKTNRHQKILELINRYPINTQEELIEYLRADGYEVTQSTASRDIKQLRLVKTLMPDGKYRYQAPVNPSKGLKNNFSQLFSTSVVSAQHAMNIVVIKTLNGLAQGACAALDSVAYEGILGTLAGDDTIIAVCRDEATAEKYAKDFNKYAD